MNVDQKIMATAMRIQESLVKIHAIRKQIYELTKQMSEEQLKLSDLRKQKFADRGVKAGDTIYLYETPVVFIDLPSVMQSDDHIIVKPQKGRRFTYQGPWGKSPKKRPEIEV